MNADSSPFFSIIIPVYNVEKYLRECVESVLEQTYTDYEIILVDDGSLDKSPEICDSYNDRKNIKVCHKSNGGLSDARNCGLNIACGEYVIFLDSDDYWSDYGFLKKLQALVLKRRPDVIVFGYNKCFENGIRKSYIPKSNCKDINDLLRIGEFNIGACDKAVKRELLIENKIKFRRHVYSEDMEWCARVFASAVTCAVFPYAPYEYRQRSGSITKQISEKNIIDIRSNFERCIEIGKTLDTSKKEPYCRYLSKNISMFMIELSKLEKKEQKKYYPFIKRNIRYLKKATRNRERIMYTAVCLLGANFVESLLGWLVIYRRKVEK